MSHDFRGFPGTKRYVPRRLLGVGGMGAVYDVLDRTTGARVALKVMLAEDPERLLRFKQEFRVMAEVHHPNLVRLFDLSQHEGQWFFTMELVHGQNLLQVLLHDEVPRAAATTVVAPPRSLQPASEDARDRAPVTEPTPKQMACDADAFVLIIAQVLDALAFLHGRGIVHRDLKPTNILVDVDGVVRVLDFGLASRIDRAMAISEAGVVIGTLAYMSPEQYRGETATAASDLYALGCMMFQLVTGDLPFQGTPMEMLAARCDKPPPRIDERVAGAPPDVVAIVHRLMARDPAERPSIAEVREALGAAPRSHTAKPAGASAETTSEIFVGRKRELSILEGCLDRAAGGQAHLALVSGASGIGKSALSSMLVRRAKLLGFACFQGRCYEREQVPFVAFDRVMDALALALRGWPRDRLAPLLPSLIVLERIFPAFGVLTGSSAPIGSAGDATDPRERRQQAIDGFRALCVRWQATTPLCFVLDDLQWADEESVELLSAIVAGNAGRIMVVGTFRSGAIRADHPLERLLRELGVSSREQPPARDGDARVTVLPIEALDSADAAQLVEAVTGSQLDARMAEALASQTANNPFLVRRLAEHIAKLAPGERSSRLDAVGSASDLLSEMIAALSPRAEQVLALASTAGGDIAASLLREASGLGALDFDLAVGELMAARFFKAVPRASGAETPDDHGGALPHLDLYHDRIREAAYQALAEDRRRALHRKLAEAIEAQAADHASDAEVLARHWAGAGDVALRRKYSVDAAEQAEDKLAFVRAARLFRVALDDPEPGEPPLVTAARWERVGRLLEYAGHQLEAARAYQEAQRRWDDAPEAHPERRVARLRLRSLAGASLMAGDEIAEACAVLESGLAMVGLPLHRPIVARLGVLAALRCELALASRLPSRRSADPFEAAKVQFLDRLVRALQPLWPWPAAESALRCEIAARRIDDKALLHRSLAYGAAVPVILGRAPEAALARSHEQLDQAEALARAHDLPLGRELAQMNRSVVWLASNMARAERACEAALAGFAARGVRHSYDGGIAGTYYVIILYYRGDYDRALSVIERDLASPRSDGVHVTYAMLMKVMILARRGETSAARAVIDRLRDRLARFPPSRMHFLQSGAHRTLLVAEGRFEEALEAVARDEQLAKDTGAWVLGVDRCAWVGVLVDAAIGLLRRGALPTLKRVLARRWADWLAREGALDHACFGHRALALIHHAEGRRAPARRSLARALSLSSGNAGKFARWLCLEAARDLGTITMDQETEAEELAAEGRFVLPVGWRST